MCSKEYAESMELYETLLHHRCLDIKLQNIFRINMFENTTRQILLMVVLMIDLSLDSQLT